MAKSMIQRRQDAERERTKAYEASLQRVSLAPRPTPDFERAIEEAHRGFGMAVRDGKLWRPKLKTRDRARLRLAAARYLFALYPVPAALEAIWLDSSGLDAEEIKLRKGWYIAVAGGKSLYKAGASKWLSRKEVHCFVNVAGGFSFEEAFWYAIARSYTDDPGLAARFARTKIARTARSQLVFWREVIRFFCQHPASKDEIDDLCDYIGAMHRRDRAYSLKGRTLASLHRQMLGWHRDLAAVARIEAMRRRAAGPGQQMQGAGWAGSPLEDWDWLPSAREAKARGEYFSIRQLKTAEDLVSESQAMHHCVSSYAAKCIAGNASIWTLRRKALGKTERLLTIELDPRNRAVQVRGFGNRVDTLEERKILERWARARGVVLAA
ncbi:PcfJ domain-containing protein [Mesorhizobium sp.]|uniref:PcfJ domain-containing protein n=1 Tax=Mesorhizobium sp. TaxID=1871066 RepID=UPI0025DDD891|nr:PcfJ domain-containing protein [Mesorhizobium sp.]